MMKPIEWFGSFLLVCSAVSGCGGPSSPEDLFSAAQRAAAEQATRGKAREQFQSLVEKFPHSEYAPRALKQLAMLVQQDGRPDSAVILYQRLLDEYPASDQADEAQFMIAFIDEEYLHDLDGAREAYQRVIDHYPHSELAASARRLLPHVGRDPEEWVRFEDSSTDEGSR